MCGILQKMKNALKIVGRGHLHFGIKRSNKSWICKRELSFTKEGAISKIKYLPTKLQFLRLNFYQTLWNYTKAEWPINSGSLFFYLFISEIILFDSSDSKSKHYPYQGTCYFLPENMWVPPITRSALFRSAWGSVYSSPTKSCLGVLIRVPYINECTICIQHVHLYIYSKCSLN